MSAKKIYKIKQPYTYNTTIWEFDNVILELYNYLGKNLYSKINDILRYDTIYGNIRILPGVNKFFNIVSFSRNEVTLSKRMIASNIEFKDEYILLYCNNLSFKVDYVLYESEDFRSIEIKYMRNSAKDIYRISLPKYYNDYLQGMSNIYITSEESTIDFGNMGQLLRNHVSMDQDFIDCYIELTLGRI